MSRKPSVAVLIDPAVARDDVDPDDRTLGEMFAAMIAANDAARADMRKMMDKAGEIAASVDKCAATVDVTVADLYRLHRAIKALDRNALRPAKNRDRADKVDSSSGGSAVAQMEPIDL